MAIVRTRLANRPSGRPCPSAAARAARMPNHAMRMMANARNIFVPIETNRSAWFVRRSTIVALTIENGLISATTHLRQPECAQRLGGAGRRSREQVARLGLERDVRIDRNRFRIPALTRLQQLLFED